MDFALTSTEIWQLAYIKLLFYLFIGLGIFFLFKFKKPIVLVSLIALFLGLTYFVIIQQSHLTWWGLEGDEIFVTSFLERVASGQFFTDFFYANLPPFYPPLYFWLVGGVGFLFKLNGIQAAQLGVTLVLFITPLLVYFWQKRYWQNFKKENLEGWKLVLAPLLIFVVEDWSAIILKPYEFISAVLAVFWTTFLLQDLQLKNLNLKKLIFYGITGGLLFLTFYFWFFLILLAAVLFKLFSSSKTSYYFGNLALITLIIILLSLPFTLPLLLSYLSFGSENWQPAFFVPADLNLYLPFLQFSIFGLVSLIGLLTMIIYWQRPYVRALLILLISTYLWQLISLITITFFSVPFEPAKPFLFLSGAVLSISAAYGIGEFIGARIKQKNVINGLAILGWIILATQLLGGSYLDDPKVQQQLLIMKQGPREEFMNLIEELKNIEGIKDLTILSSGMSQLSAYLPLNNYISYNAHYSHPAANFSQRYYFISGLSKSVSADDFYQKIKNPPFEPIDALLLFKNVDKYPFYFWIDDYPLGGREETIEVPADLLNEQYFDKVFEDEYFVFYRVK